MTADARTLRTEIDAEIAAGNHERARALLGRLWRENPGAGLARYIESRFDTIAPQLDLVSCRLAILRSFTVEPLIPMLRAAAYAGGMRLEVRVCDFNAYAQEILRPDSALYAFAPDVVILAVRTLDVAPELRQGANALSEGRQDAIIDGVIDEVSALLTALRERSNASVVVHSFETPATPSLGILDAQLGDGQAEAIRRLNTRLAGELRGRSGMYLLDYDALVARYGRLGWADARKWLSVRLPLAAEHGIHLVEEWLRFLHPIAGRVCKALVVDLDNTLWGGVIGEDGIAGIALGEGDPGAFHSGPLPPRHPAGDREQKQRGRRDHGFGRAPSDAAETGAVRRAPDQLER
jgi:predicted enzyme involved in methoxymalonyl-ACP biosynthesis